MARNPMGADARPSNTDTNQSHNAPVKRRRLARAARFLTTPFQRRRAAAVPPAKTSPATGAARSGDHVIRGFAVAILLGVAGAAGYVSYHHFYALSIRLGEQHDMAVLYPAMSDGVIVMASLVMVYCSRRRLPVPPLAWIALAVGGAVTLVANVANGWHGGTGTRLLSALAPVAFVGAYELLMWLVRSGRTVVEAADEQPVEEHVCHSVEVPVEVERVVTVLPVDRHEAARLTFEESLQPGNRRVGRRTLMNRWGLEQREVEEIMAEVEQGRAAPASPEAAPLVPAQPAVPSLNGSSATGTAVAP